MSNFNDVYQETNDTAQLSLGGELEGDIELKSGKEDLILKISSKGGAIKIFDENENEYIKISTADAEVVLGNLEFNNIFKMSGRYGTNIEMNGHRADVIIGGADNAPGDLYVRNQSNSNTCILNGGNGNLTLGNHSTNGTISIKDAAGNLRIYFDAESGRMRIKDPEGNDMLNFASTTASLVLGGIGEDGDLRVRNSSNVDTIRINGGDGDIEFLNADFAEEFDIDLSVKDQAIPGTLMSINKSGKLTLVDNCYDSTVIGVVAGAGKFKPALILDKKNEGFRLPIAVVGKVYCQLDASNGAITYGDLITSSTLAGHGMLATDKLKAVGSIIGKSLGTLESGKGLVPVLVNLQ